MLRELIYIGSLFIIFYIVYVVLWPFAQIMESQATDVSGNVVLTNQGAYDSTVARLSWTLRMLPYIFVVMLVLFAVLAMFKKVYEAQHLGDEYI